MHSMTKQSQLNTLDEKKEREVKLKTRWRHLISSFIISFTYTKN